MFILDTCVLSNLKLKYPDLNLVRWIDNQARAISLPFSAVFEIQRGITMLEGTNPEKASELSSWLDDILASDIPFLEMDARITRLYARMTCVPALRHLCVPALNAKRLKLGQDLAIAATAIVKDAPVATMNTKDFLRIHRYFTLPGLFNPQQERWLIPPRQQKRIEETITLPETGHLPAGFRMCPGSG
ncbi:hypothetical protein [Chelativorans sp. Marseille-P2723]|uniref:hypothetical protein n=1 Tax=Chelativorans sp. Marseille-P2723 TaxID=2709133 RepID=UPI001570EDE0|nr:hypothetical protein [Chelativorans sp. Marseille-P2723]